MPRLSLRTTSSRQHKQQKRASLSLAFCKLTNSLHSSSGNLSMLSSTTTSASSNSLMSLSTASSSYGGFVEDYEIEDEAVKVKKCSQQGWMYWKQRDDCWLKMYARLYDELLWLSKGSDDAIAVIQIAVAGVRTTEDGGFIAHGPAGESMELFAYERNRTSGWIDALFVAAQLTESYKRSMVANPSETEISNRESKVNERVYIGTLVIYNKEQGNSSWKQLLSTKRLRGACRQRLEKILDRLDTSKR